MTEAELARLRQELADLRTEFGDRMATIERRLMEGEEWRKGAQKMIEDAVTTGIKRAQLAEDAAKWLAFRDKLGRIIMAVMLGLVSIMVAIANGWLQRLLSL